MYAANSLFVDAEDIKDLKRLCTTFAHVENLITLAASLHRKFMQAPRLSESIFNDYDNFHVPKLGTVSIGRDVQKVRFFALVLSLLLFQDFFFPECYSKNGSNILVKNY